MNRILLLFLCLAIATFTSCDKPNDSQEPNKPKLESVETITIQPVTAPLPKQVEAPKPGMVYIPGGKFLMGGDAAEKAGESHSHQTAYPIREVQVDGFWMDEAEVTNRSFGEFAEATNYKTFAEKPLPPETIKQLKAAAEQSLKGMQQALETVTGDEKAALLASIERVKEAAKTLDSAGAIVFAKPEGTIYGADITQWWQIVPGATWRRPDGPNGPSWQDRLDHPVVNVTYDDAAAYAKWAGKRIPTEAEWEKAARGGLERNLYSWGTELFPEGKSVWMANIWQGEWPKDNKMLDGFYATSPAKSFPPNGYGLYDIAGNVWEIVADLYHPQAYQLPSAKLPNPTGPTEQETRRPGQRTVLRVTRGGSFLCSDTWCKGYQPGARQPFDNESPANHTGFRCVISVKDNN